MGTATGLCPSYELAPSHSCERGSNNVARMQVGLGREAAMGKVFKQLSQRTTFLRVVYRATVRRPAMAPGLAVLGARPHC